MSLYIDRYILIYRYIHKNMNVSIKYNQEHVSTAIHCKHSNNVYWYWLSYSNSVLQTTTTTYYDTEFFSVTRNIYSLTVMPLLPWAQQCAMGVKKNQFAQRLGYLSIFLSSTGNSWVFYIYIKIWLRVINTY